MSRKDLIFAGFACLFSLGYCAIAPKNSTYPKPQSQSEVTTTASASPKQELPKPEESKPEENPKPEIDMAAFSKVQTGMTLAEVEAILGKGELQSESEFGGLKTQFYSWNAGFLKGISVTIQDGVATSKSQIGLQNP